MILILACHGCATYRSGDLSYYSRDNASGFDFPASKEINLLVTVNQNFDSSDEDYKQSVRTAVEERISSTLEKEGYAISLMQKPSEEIKNYIEVSVILDWGVDDLRKEDFFGLRMAGAIISGLTLTLVPTRDSDIYQYIVVKRVENSEVTNTVVFEQDAHRYMGFFMLFSAPFYTVKNAVEETVEESIISLINI